jgi:tRNA pseudouridine55 synthase
MDGLLLIRKPAGPTSHDIIARLRKILGQKRIGHFGTLDPLASGLLVVAAGRATRFFPYYGKLDKTYEGRIRLGFATDTYDREGRRTGPETDRLPGPDALLSAMKSFEGKILQRPPVFSAKKFEGKPLYAYARRGKSVEPAPVPVEVAAFELRNYDPPFLDFRVDCGSGTYIRSLAHDLGVALGCGAHLADLVRTRVGDFSLAAALPLEDIEARQARSETAGFLLPLETLLPGLPRYDLTEEGSRRMKDGRPVGPEHLASGEFGPPSAPPDATAIVRLFGPDGALLALAHPAPPPAQFAPFLVLL